MLSVGKDLASYTLAAGEPFVLEVQLLNSAGRGIDIDDQAMVLSFYTASTRAVVTDFAGNASQYEGVRLSDTTGEYFRWAFDGRWSETMLSKPGIRVELAQRLFYGRRIISTGALSVVSSAAIVPSLADATIALTDVRVTIKASAILGAAPTISHEVILYEGPSDPVPAPLFNTPSAVSSDGTPQVGELLTGVDGIASNTVSYTRRWLLGSTVLTSSATYTPATEGVYRYETIATGPGGVTTSGSNITVAAATPLPPPTLSQPSISPTSGTVGATFTATDGTVTNGTLTGRRWLLGGVAIGTGTTVTPNAAGSLTLENAALGSNGVSITATSVAVTVAPVVVAPTLNALSVSPSSATAGSAYSGNISGLTSGSTVALSGAGATGLSIAGGIITGTPTTAGAVNLVETLAGATGSPRTSSGVVTVAAVITPPAPSALDGFSVVLTRNGQRMSAPLAALVA